MTIRAEDGEKLEAHGQGGSSESKGKGLTLFGSMLFHRHVSGTRVIERHKRAAVEGIDFSGYGAHHDAYPHNYVTVAAAIGTKKEDVDEFALRFKSCWKQYQRLASRSS